MCCRSECKTIVLIKKIAQKIYLRTWTRRCLEQDTKRKLFQKSKIDKFDYIKEVLLIKNPRKRTDKLEWENLFATYTIQKELLEISKNKAHTQLKTGYFNRKDTQMVKKT